MTKLLVAGTLWVLLFLLAACTYTVRVDVVPLPAAMDTPPVATTAPTVEPTAALTPTATLPTVTPTPITESPLAGPTSPLAAPESSLAAALAASSELADRDRECNIKGVLVDSAYGQSGTYYLPNDDAYIVVDENAGGRWFCSEEQAIMAGWDAR